MQINNTWIYLNIYIYTIHIWCDIKLYQIIKTSKHITSCHVPCVICHTVLYHVLHHYINHTRSYHIIPYDMLQLDHHIIWYQIISHITSNKVSCCFMSLCTIYTCMLEGPVASLSVGQNPSWNLYKTSWKLYAYILEPILWILETIYWEICPVTVPAIKQRRLYCRQLPCPKDCIPFT